jgi:flagellar biogenesis protein FliO
VQVQTRGADNDGTQRHVKVFITLLIALGLLAFTFWFAELATYNMWAAGRPNVLGENLKTYIFRSNTFFILTVISFLAFVVFSCWRLIRMVRRKQGHSPSAGKL